MLRSGSQVELKHTCCDALIITEHHLGRKIRENILLFRREPERFF